VIGLIFLVFVSLQVKELVMFGSNVQPKRRIKDIKKEPWYCHTCDLEHPHYYSKCPKCAGHRPH
jgi:hypothetical protein